MASYTKVTRQGLGSRTKNSFGGVIVGLVLLAVATVLLFWNEGRSVKRYQGLKEGAGAVVSIPSDQVDPAYEGQLVHLSGELATEEPLIDEDFGILVDAIRLSRKVETYQWIEEVKRETREKVGGSRETVETFTYRADWREGLVDSSRFKVQEGHRNPTDARFASSSVTADSVSLDAFRLPPFLVAKVGGSEPFPIENLEGASEEVRTAATVSGAAVYFGSPQSPEVGDTRVSFSVVRAGPVSVVAQQEGDSFVPYRAKSGVNVDLLQRGTVSADEMFESAQASNRLLTWGIRVGGFFMLSTGFSLILGPLAVFASILPILGRIVRAGTTVISFILAGIVWSIVVSIAWIFYRPVLGIAILVVTVALLVMLVKRLRAAKAGAPGNVSASPPPTAA